jgi:hypothetical protein
VVEGHYYGLASGELANHDVSGFPSSVHGLAFVSAKYAARLGTQGLPFLATSWHTGLLDHHAESPLVGQCREQIAREQATVTATNTAQTGTAGQQTSLSKLHDLERDLLSQ